MWKPICVGVVVVLGISVVFGEDILDKCSRVDGAYVFLRSNHVNGRYGPSRDYPCVRVYKRRFLPMKILSEQGEWFFLQDWEGERVWVHRSLCSKRKRYVLTTQSDVSIKDDVCDNAKTLAVVARMVCLELVRFKGPWLRVKVSSDQRKCTGWIPQHLVWGWM